jgi:hypothetical protein
MIHKALQGFLVASNHRENMIKNLPPLHISHLLDDGDNNATCRMDNYKADKIIPSSSLDGLGQARRCHVTDKLIN